MKNADTYRNEGMRAARKEQERPLRVRRGEALLAVLDAATPDQKAAARAELLRADEALRAVGIQP
jgi:hypothetical protein